MSILVQGLWFEPSFHILSPLWFDWKPWNLLNWKSKFDKITRCHKQLDPKICRKLRWLLRYHHRQEESDPLPSFPPTESQETPKNSGTTPFNTHWLHGNDGLNGWFFKTFFSEFFWKGGAATEGVFILVAIVVQGVSGGNFFVFVQKRCHEACKSQKLIEAWHCPRYAAVPFTHGWSYATCNRRFLLDEAVRNLSQSFP